MKTIGQQIKWNFKTNGDLEIKDKNGKLIYWENYGVWTKYERDSKGNRIYYESSNGYWIKFERDSKGNQIYFEDSRGVIKDQRPKPCSDKEIVIDGVKYKLTKV